MNTRNLSDLQKEKIKEVFQRIINDIDGLEKGICTAVNNLYFEDDGIDSFEKQLVLAFLKDNKPSFFKHQEFFHESSFISNGSVWWWPRGAVNQRELFIQKLIKQLS